MLGVCIQCPEFPNELHILLLLFNNYLIICLVEGEGKNPILCLLGLGEENSNMLKYFSVVTETIPQEILLRYHQVSDQVNYPEKSIYTYILGYCVT